MTMLTCYVFVNAEAIMVRRTRSSSGDKAAMLTLTKQWPHMLWTLLKASTCHYYTLPNVQASRHRVLQLRVQQCCSAHVLDNQAWASIGIVLDAPDIKVSILCGHLLDMLLLDAGAHSQQVLP